MSTQDLLCHKNPLLDILSFLLSAMPRISFNDASVVVRASEGIVTPRDKEASEGVGHP